MLSHYSIHEIRATGERIRAYGDDIETILEERGLTEEDVELIPVSRWSAEEIAALIGEEAENANYHDLTSIGEDLLQGLEEDGFSEEEKARVLRILAAVIGNMF